MSMTKLLIVTTPNDLSIDSFLDISGVETEVIYYGDDMQSLTDVDLVYFRDPFVVQYDIGSIERTVREVARAGAYSIDHIKSIDDLFFEDKWKQYLRLSSYMPNTRLLSDGVDAQGVIIKKRISSRAKAIMFDTSEVEGDFEDYIIQDMMEIHKEYRVYCVAGNIIDTVSVKTSKTKTQKVKVDHIEPLPSDVGYLCSDIMRAIPELDFVGIDLARTPEGLRLIEVNRAPQFKKFSELTGVNLAEILARAVMERGGLS